MLSRWRIATFGAAACNEVIVFNWLFINDLAWIWILGFSPGDMIRVQIDSQVGCLMSLPRRAAEGPSLASIEATMNQILQSERFRNAHQLQGLLEYTVKNSLQGDEDLLKERIIGINVFRRKPDYDTADDPIVRARMGQLRKRLAQFYESEESSGSTVRIAIPHGSYRPTFVFLPEADNFSQDRLKENRSQTEVPDRAEEDPESENNPHLPRSLRPPQWRIWGMAAAVACAVLSIACIGVARWDKSEFDLYWGPFLESKKAVIVYAGTIPAYLPSTSFVSRLVSQDGGNHESPGAMIALPALEEGQTLTSKDLVAYRGGLASIGDIAADVTLVSLLSAHRQNFEFRSGPDLSFVDLHGSPTILIGALSNYLTLYMTRDLPFYFDHDWRIRERGGRKRVWATAGLTTYANEPASHPANSEVKAQLVHSVEPGPAGDAKSFTVFGANSTATEDYAIIARLMDSKTGGPVIIIAGLQSCGNQAAAEFLTDPEQMKKLASIPRDVLERKNLELVLHTSLVKGTPASVEIEAERDW